MMKAKKMWLAQHPTQSDNIEVRFTEPPEECIFLDSYLHTEEPEYVKYKEYIIIEIEES
jgi:hypothetical protein